MCVCARACVHSALARLLKALFCHLQAHPPRRLLPSSFSSITNPMLIIPPPSKYSTHAAYTPSYACVEALVCLWILRVQICGAIHRLCVCELLSKINKPCVRFVSRDRDAARRTSEGREGKTGELKREIWRGCDVGDIEGCEGESSRRRKNIWGRRGPWRQGGKKKGAEAGGMR